jgi:isocitrate dehydrogenase (NAD+)
MRRVVQAGARLLNASSALRSSTQPCLSMTNRLYSSETITCTLFPGDGIGPEIADAVKEIFEAAKAPIDWDEQYIGKVADPRTNSMVTRENLDSVLVRPALHLDVRFMPSI